MRFAIGAMIIREHKTAAPVVMNDIEDQAAADLFQPRPAHSFRTFGPPVTSFWKPFLNLWT